MPARTVTTWTLEMTTRPELAATLRLAAPLVGANLLQMAVYAVDVVFVASATTDVDVAGGSESSDPPHPDTVTATTSPVVAIAKERNLPGRAERKITGQPFGLLPSAPGAHRAPTLTSGSRS